DFYQFISPGLQIEPVEDTKTVSQTLPGNYTYPYYLEELSSAYLHDVLKCGLTSFQTRSVDPATNTRIFVNDIHNYIPSTYINQYCLTMTGYILDPRFPIDLYIYENDQVKERLKMINIYLNKTYNDVYDIKPIFEWNNNIYRNIKNY